MRSVVVGLVCAMFAALTVSTVAHAAGAPPLDAGQRAKGMKAAPALITAASLDCQVADAYYIGDQDDPKTHKKNGLYEIACSNGPGVLIIAHPDNTSQTVSCLELEGGPAGNFRCMLPGNANAAAGFTPIVSKVDPKCQVAKARALGQTADGHLVLEIACDQICGNGHYSMKGVVKVVSQEEFILWKAKQKAAYYTAFPDKDPTAPKAVASTQY